MYSAFFCWAEQLTGEAQKLVDVKVAAGVDRAMANPAIEIRLENHRSILVSSGFDDGSLAGGVGGVGAAAMIGLPSLHSLDQSKTVRIWWATEKTDMR